MRAGLVLSCWGAALFALSCSAGDCAEVDAEPGSVAVGRTNSGSLRNAADALRGAGPLRLLPACAKRGLHYTTDEMARSLHRAAALVASAYPGSELNVGNLSAREGGRTPYSASHQNGLDADLAFFVLDEQGRPVAPEDYIRFGSDLRSLEPGVRYRFDVARNWALTEALLTDDEIRVRWLFISPPLRQALLAHARETGASWTVRARAARVLHQPSDAPAHNDHFHLRIHCPTSDRPLGCRDGTL